MQVMRETQENMALQMEHQQEAKHHHMMNNFNLVHENQASMLGNMHTMQEQLQQMQVSQNT